MIEHNRNRNSKCGNVNVKTIVLTLLNRNVMSNIIETMPYLNADFNIGL